MANFTADEVASMAQENDNLHRINATLTARIAALTQERDLVRDERDYWRNDARMQMTKCASVMGILETLSMGLVAGINKMKDDEQRRTRGTLSEMRERAEKRLDVGQADRIPVRESPRSGPEPIRQAVSRVAPTNNNPAAATVAGRPAPANPAYDNDPRLPRVEGFPDERIDITGAPRHG